MKIPVYTFRKYSKIAGIGFLLLHFGAIIMYSFPDYFGSQTPIHRAIYRYIKPLFVQNFHILSPEPPIYNPDIFIQVTYSDGTRSPWFCPGFTYRQVIQHFPFSADRFQLNVYEKMSHTADFVAKQKMQASPYALQLKKYIIWQAIEKDKKRTPVSIQSFYAESRAVYYPEKPLIMHQAIPLFMEKKYAISH